MAKEWTQRGERNHSISTATAYLRLMEAIAYL